ncbi:MFS transporter [Acidaminobacter sp. JC074]|uniref:MFS transporter n=1 Tax=Acidaminobacter sp. JC074 TaxID=2530199 RepID=UPI0021071FE9|nr:MFS transporter [Acidaminobacter sp. JC074]MCH4888999.1 MFS transporter [Acidaminobacter sp. JC074]
MRTSIWLGQSVSSLGSSMTSFAITIWAFERTGSALTLFISGMLIMAPKMFLGVFLGPLIDRMNKKAIILISDIGAGVCTLTLFLLLRADSLEIWHIYSLNFLSSILSSFQYPASDVAVSLIVPKKYYVKASGMQSFSNGKIQMLAPIFAAFFLALTDMSVVIFIDFVTLAFSTLTLAFMVKIPFDSKEKGQKFCLMHHLQELRKGFSIIWDSILLKKLLLFMAFINFLAGLTYFNILSPMILARTGHNVKILGFVNGAIGLGGIIGGLIVVIMPTMKSKVRTMFLYAGLSFFLGDFLFAFGNSMWTWGMAGFLTSVFIPPLIANESYFWRTIIPVEMQGCAFSFKYAMKSGMIPIGMLIGGILADYVFEPFMTSEPNYLSFIFKSGEGMGMALMFFITGILGTCVSLRGFFNTSLLEAEQESENSSDEKIISV